MSDSALYERRPATYSGVILKRRVDRSPMITPLALHAANSSSSIATTTGSHQHNRASFISLPYDILLSISDLLSVEDIDALGKTCRTLRSFCQTRTIWLKLAMSVLNMCKPLPVSGFQRLLELKTPELASVVRRGNKLQHNWAKHKPKLVYPYRMIKSPENEDIVWLSPITSKYTLCCTKGGKVMCWDVYRRECVAEWHSGSDWEIWKCRVEFEERTVYFAMAKRARIGKGTDCLLMALSFPHEVNGVLAGKSTFSQLSSFRFPGDVISVYLLDPLRRLLSAYILIEATRTLGLYVLLDWAIPNYVFLDTGIPCDPLREWSCIGYDPENVVIHAEQVQGEIDWAFQFSYSYSFLRSIATAHPPIGIPPRISPTCSEQLPFLPNKHPFFRDYCSQSAHFVRQWWPTLPSTDHVRRRSCAIILLAKRVGPEIEDDANANANAVEGVAPDHLPPGTYLFTIAQHYFSIPLCSKQLRWWYVREPFEVVCSPQMILIPSGHDNNEDGGGHGDAQLALEIDNQNANGQNPENVQTLEVAHAVAATAQAHAPNPAAPFGLAAGAAIPANHPLAQAAYPLIPEGDEPFMDDLFDLDEGEIGLHAVPLVAVDFGCAVWLEYVSFASEEKRLRLVTFPSVDVDRSDDEAYNCLSEEGDVRTLDVPPEIDLGQVCHIGIDQAQGTVILGLSTGNVYILHYR